MNESILLEQKIRHFLRDNRIVRTEEQQACYELIRDWELIKFEDSSGKEPEWINVKDRPLVTYDSNGNLTATDDGDTWFIGALQYHDDKDKKLHWWIRHCVLEDEIGLCVVGDSDNEPAGWDIKDIEYWKPFPKNNPLESVPPYKEEEKQKFSDTEILNAVDEYSKNGKQKHKGVTSFDFLAGARWMEKVLSASATPNEKDIIAEQDRMIGELTRKVNNLEDTEQKRQEWLSNAKKEAGFDNNESFDNVWKTVLNSYLSASASKDEGIVKVSDFYNKPESGKDE